jgi:hypothetical protein
MNIVQLQDQLKNFSQDQLVREMQMPSGNAPQFLVLGEIMRRQKMQQDFTAQQAKGDQGTVAQEAVAAAGVPQGGITDMARAMAPSTDMTQNTGVQAMYAGGPVKKMAAGDVVVKEGLRFIEQEDGSLRPEGGVTSLTRLPAAPDRSGGIGTLSEDPMLKAAEESANEVAAAREEAGITQSLKTPEEVAAAAAAAKEAEAANNPAAEEAAPAAPKAGGAGGSGMSSYEQELMAMMQKREQAAEQDKWLSLAQVGLNLMSSTQPTLGGALGEAGLKGVEAAQGARDQYDKDRLSLLGELEQSRAARAAATAKAAKGATAKPVSTAIIGQYTDQLSAIDEQLAIMGPPPEPGWWSGDVDDPYAAERTRLEEQRAAIQAALGYGYATHGMPYFDAASEYDADVSD